MLLRWSEIYSNTEILSPIDRDTWRVIAETCNLNASSRAIELASGKGAFANYLAENFQCGVDAFEINTEFVDYSNKRADELGLKPKVRFKEADINNLEVMGSAYDLGACLGAMYFFREKGWKVLLRATKPRGYLAVSETVCKKVPPPKELAEFFFEGTGTFLTLEDARKWYETREVEILRLETCSTEAWLKFYDLTRENLSKLSTSQPSNTQLQSEIGEFLREDRLFRKYGLEYVEYLTFIMQKAHP